MLAIRIGLLVVLSLAVWVGCSKPEGNLSGKSPIGEMRSYTIEEGKIPNYHFDEGAIGEIVYEWNKNEFGKDVLTVTMYCDTCINSYRSW